MGSSLGVSDTMALISSKLSNIVPFSCCALFLYNDGARDAALPLRDRRGSRDHPAADDPQRLRPDRAGSRATGGRWSTRGPSTDLEAAGFPSGSTTLQSALVCPLLFNERFIGTISVYHTEPSIYTDDHRRLLDRISEQAAAVIYNSIVFEQTQEDSLTDPLTGLPNTRFMFMHLTRELARAERLKAEVSLLVMDLDNFKDINDTFGHHVGDRALREVAGVLRTGIRPYDICVRYAGDEFIVVLSGCSGEEAERKRLELQRAVDEPRSSRRGPARCCRSRSASARRSSRTTATHARRCWPPRTAGCTATRRGASARSQARIRPATHARRSTPPEPDRRRPAARRPRECC